MVRSHILFWFNTKNALNGSYTHEHPRQQKSRPLIVEASRKRILNGMGDRAYIRRNVYDIHYTWHVYREYTAENQGVQWKRGVVEESRKAEPLP